MRTDCESTSTRLLVEVVTDSLGMIWGGWGAAACGFWRGMVSLQFSRRVLIRAAAICRGRYVVGSWSSCDSSRVASIMHHKAQWSGVKGRGKRGEGLPRTSNIHPQETAWAQKRRHLHRKTLLTCVSVVLSLEQDGKE